MHCDSRMRQVSNTTLGLMGVVASVAGGLATYSAVVSERGDRFLGLVIVLTCLAGVTALRTVEAITARRGHGEPWTVRWLSTAILSSCIVATLIVGLADLAFVLAYGLVAGGPAFFLFSSAVRHRSILLEGLVAGALAAIAVCYVSRRAFWRYTPIRGRSLPRLTPLAVVALLLGANLMWMRIEDRLARASQHDVWARIYGGESSVPAAPGFPPKPEVAAYHSRMRRKWEQAAARPWLPVDPDPPPPEP
jgi:hypothetical protein